MHGLRLQSQTKVGINTMNDAMTTDTARPEPTRLPSPTAVNDAPKATLRTLSTATRRRTVWTPGLILRRILERERAGLSLKASAVQRDSANLSNAARRHFGSWEHAVMNARKAGSDRIAVHTRETIIALLLEHDATGLPMSTIYPLTKKCYKPAVRLFGSWGAALRAAGLEPLAHGLKPRHTRESLIAKLREQAASGLPVSSKHSFLRSFHKPAIRLFGSWAAALAAAEIDQAKHIKRSKTTGEAVCPWKAGRQLEKTPPGGIRNYNREQILEILRERGRTGKSVSSCHPDMQPYLSAAQRLFGSWTKAREEAGYGRPRSFTKDEVLAALARAFDGNRIPHMRDADLRPYVPAACRIFGKWREAVRQAKEQWSEGILQTQPCGGSPKETETCYCAIFRASQ